MDPLHSRELATLAMLPRWEGFCTDNQEGHEHEMTAWDAVTTVLNVEHCMCKSKSIEQYQRHSLQSDVPREFNFGKVKFGTTSTVYTKTYNFILIMTYRQDLIKY